MRFIATQSTQIAAFGYDQDDHTLVVQFQNGSFYAYDDVPESVVLSVFLAESQGTAFDKKVKKEGYTYRKLSDDEVTKLQS